MVEGSDLTLPAVFDDLNVGVTLHSSETGTVLDVNHRLTELYGYSRDELVEMEVGDYSAPSTTFTQAEAEDRITAAAAGDPQSFEWQIQRSNGEVRWVQVHLNASVLAGTDCVLAEVHDITESRRRERRLRLLSRIIRHNLRNKSTALVGYAGNIEQAVEDNTLEQQAETLLELGRKVGSLSDSVSQLEEITALGGDERVRTDVGDLVGRVADTLREAAPSASVSVESPPAVWVLADTGLEYALDHALENAVEHNPADEPTVDITVEAREGIVEIRVVDDGPLIPENEVAVLDEEVEATSTYHGTGVGLWVMEWAVSSLGGELSFTENAAGGNTVTFTLPRAAPP
ncbi:PAS domain-containing sensor histidine kinase [Haloarcula litorea]|uniref:sensor histidine kinase n=1 Tax=Haloarcula litorea TaxID=3032579 RepID=UPI0023E86E62|nr:PAS domain-containing sensor histidine kinase [Halomicroarcula sp. GDY20]